MNRLYYSGISIHCKGKSAQHKSSKKNGSSHRPQNMSPTTNVLPQTHPMSTLNPRKIIVIVNLPIFFPCYPPKETPFCSIMSMSFS